MVTETSVHIQKRVQCVLFGLQTPLTKCDHRNTSWTCLLYTVHDRVCGPAVYTYYFSLWFILFYASRNQYAITANLPFLIDSAPRISLFGQLPLTNFMYTISHPHCHLRSETIYFTQHLSTSRRNSYQTKTGVRIPKVTMWTSEANITIQHFGKLSEVSVQNYEQCCWTYTHSRTYGKTKSVLHQIKRDTCCNHFVLPTIIKYISSIQKSCYL
jgi:hypothetical protein